MPLTLTLTLTLTKVGACGLSIRIKGRTFSLRARDEVARDAFVAELKVAMTDPNLSLTPLTLTLTLTLTL